MNSAVEVHVVRVFTDKKGKFGSPAGIVIDENRDISPEKRQEITKKLGYSETVFINKVNPVDVSIFALASEIPFAGAPLVGAAWFIEKELDNPIESITCQGKTIKVVHDEGLVWVIAQDLSILPNWNLEELKSPDDVEKLSPLGKPQKEHSYLWAWKDKSLRVGRVRARTIAPDWGISEEEANGSGSMLLANKLGRSLLIKHGKGSYIRATSGGTGVAVGGLVVEDRSLTL